jgi:hypothetical protein
VRRGFGWATVVVGPIEGDAGRRRSGSYIVAADGARDGGGRGAHGLDGRAVRIPPPPPPPPPPHIFL